MDGESRRTEDAFRRAPDEGLALAALIAGERARKPSRSVLEWTLELGRWDTLDDHLQEAAARTAALVLGEPFQFTGIQRHTLGSTSHRIARFDWRGRSFALIPAGTVQLGFDRESLSPHEDLLRSISVWCAERARPDGREAALEHFRSMTQDLTSLREVQLSPFAIEVSAGEWPGWGYFGARVDDHGFLFSDGAELEACLRTSEVDGLRLPNVDEWELACSGGSRELFRWGPDHPLDQPPYSDDPWRLHREPNAFGLVFPGDTNRVELCKPGKLRGGDGGIRLHGGLSAGGHTLAWLALASSFDGTRAVEQDAGLGIDDCNPALRRVKSLF